MDETMPRERSPQHEKQRDAEKQRRGFSEYAHAMRHGKWRRTKRRPAQKTERQNERQAVFASKEALTDVGFDPGPIVRPKIGKWGATPLGDWILKQKARREKRTRV